MVQVRPNTKVILFNYGGGIRGLIPAHIMAYIEDQTGLRMAEMVDIFSGPSTGAILNAALNVPSESNPGKPKYRARHMVKFYEREGRKIFPIDGSRDLRALLHDFNNRTMKIGQLKKLFRHGHYDPTYLNDCLHRLFGDTKLADAIQNLIIPVYNIQGDAVKPMVDEGESDDAPVHSHNNFMTEGGHAVWLKRIEEGMDDYRPAPDVYLHDAVMGSTAAPTYFPCHNFDADFGAYGGQKHITAIDGSIFDNPCVSYHGAIRQHLPVPTHVIMILLGTGYSMQSISKDDWNSYGNLGVVDPANDLPLINILFHAPESALIDSFHTRLGDGLFSFNKSLIHCDPAVKPSGDIDDASPENLERLKLFAEGIIEENKAQLDKLCALLVQNHERKQKESLAGGLFGFLRR